MVKVNGKMLRHLKEIRRGLDDNYINYHHPKWIGTDPVKFLHEYEDPLDQEIVGLIAASLAYGNVTAINASIQRVLKIMGNLPREFLVETGRDQISRAFIGFRHRWTGVESITALMTGMQQVIQEYGSLGEAFTSVDDGDPDITKPLARWVRQLKKGQAAQTKNMLSDPERNSACKRLHLYLRWMVRNDEIDPGCWKGIKPDRLLVPLDTHVFRFSKACGFTSRNAADRKTVEEITGVFRVITPDDPVKFDFSMTRPGIIDGWIPTGKKHGFLFDNPAVCQERKEKSK